MTDDRMTSHDVIAAHRGNHATNKTDLWTACRCGDGVRYYNPSDHARHVLAALKAEGYAVVELPAPTERETDDEVTTRWEGALPFTVDVWDDYPNEVGLAYDFNPFEPFTPNGARTLAAALLAAADAAEEGK